MSKLREADAMLATGRRYAPIQQALGVDVNTTGTPERTTLFKVAFAANRLCRSICEK